MKKHILALDGLRGLAIGIVFANHFGYMHGSRVGSEIFFVLSGFLVTKSLRSRPRYQRRKTIQDFLNRRAWRLIPGFLALISTISIICALDTTNSIDLRRSIVASVTMTINWQRALFSWNGGALGHLWSLAAEQQFYLFWPVLFLLIPYARTRFALVTMLIVSMVWRLYLSNNGSDLERISNGLDTHPDGLIAGCLLATLDTEKFKGLVAGSFALMFVAILVCLATFIPFLTPWTFSLASIGIAALAAWVVGATAQNSLPTRVLAIQPLPALGKISYGLYLWHYPVIGLFQPDWAHGTRPAQICISLILALASYYLIEQPALRWAESRRSKVRAEPAGGLAST